MDEFLSFRKMITPLFIQLIFWVGIVGIVINALITFRYSVITGLLFLIIGPLIWRIYCELVILFFRMYEELTAIRHVLGGQPPPPGGHAFPVTPVVPATPSVAPPPPAAH